MESITASLTMLYAWTCACGARIARGEAHYCSFVAEPSTPVKPMLSLVDGSVNGQSGTTE